MRAASRRAFQIEDAVATARWASRPPMVGICLAFDCLRERGLSLDLVFQTLHEAGDDFHLRVCDWRCAAGGTLYVSATAGDDTNST